MENLLQLSASPPDAALRPWLEVRPVSPGRSLGAPPCFRSDRSLLSFEVALSHAIDLGCPCPAFVLLWLLLALFGIKIFFVSDISDGHPSLNKLVPAHLSPRSPCPGFAFVFEALFTSRLKDRPWSSLSVKRPFSSRRT